MLATTFLRSGLFLLFAEESQETHTGHLDNFESDTRDITNGTALATETRNQNFVIFVNKVQATITGDESRNFLVVFHQLNANALSDGRVRLFGFNANFFENNALGVRSTTKWVSLQGGTKVGLLVAFVGPSVDTTVVAQVASGANTTGLSGTHVVK